MLIPIKSGWTSRSARPCLPPPKCEHICTNIFVTGPEAPIRRTIGVADTVQHLFFRSLLAVLLLTGVLLLAPATPVAAQHYTVWSATFTTDQTSSGTTRVGCNDTAANIGNCSTAITNPSFQYKGTTYTVTAVENFAVSGQRRTSIGFSPALEPKEFVLYINGGRYESISTATTVQSSDTYATPGVTWADDQTVTVSLVWEGSFGPPPGKPTLTPITSGSMAPTDTTLSFQITCVSPGKALVTDFVFHAVNSTDSTDRYTWNYSPVPLMCQDSSTSVSVTMPGFPRRTSTTTYNITARARNRIGVKGAWSDAVTATTTAVSMQMQAFSGGSSDPAPDPVPEASLTASFEQVPEAHNGKRKFSFLVRLSETVGNFSKSPRASSFEVTRGRVLSVEQVAGGLWRVEVKPNSWRGVEVTLAGGRDCDAPGAVCTPDIRSLSNTVTATVPGPVGLKVAGGRAREGRDAAIDFAVTLTRPASVTVTVDYATADETATAGTDYEAASGTLTFAPGETAKTVRVAILDDRVDEGREVFRLRLSNAVGAQIRDDKAAGRINNASSD